MGGMNLKQQTNRLLPLSDFQAVFGRLGTRTHDAIRKADGRQALLEAVLGGGEVRDEEDLRQRRREARLEQHCPLQAPRLAPTAHSVCG